MCWGLMPGGITGPAPRRSLGLNRSRIPTSLQAVGVTNGDVLPARSHECRAEWRRDGGIRAGIVGRSIETRLVLLIQCHIDQLEFRGETAAFFGEDQTRWRL
jgi:hypothetical protein